MSKPISFWRQTITRIRPAEMESRGSAIPDWDNADKLVISGCCVQPSSTGLSQDGRILGISEGLTPYIPVNTDIEEGDHIIYDGNEYTISGSIQKRISATGRINHVQINLERWSG